MSLRAASALILDVCGQYPADKVAQALEIWMSRESTFPTPADIAGLIRRGGKPPLERAVYIRISKMEYADRTDEERRYMWEYEAEKMADGALGEGDNTKFKQLYDDNVRLRKDLAEAYSEISKLNELLREARKDWTRPEKTMDAKVNATVEHMRKTGRTEADIDEFLLSMVQNTSAPKQKPNPKQPRGE